MTTIPSRRRVGRTPARAATLLVGLGLVATLATAPPATATDRTRNAASGGVTYDNPVYPASGLPDPQVTLGDDGYYYLTGTTTSSSIEIIRSASLTDMRGAVRKIVYVPPAPFNKDVWAPELHRIDGVWYIYTTASDLDYGTVGNPAVGRNRIQVLQNTSSDPLAGNWTNLGTVNGIDTSIGSLDGTIFESGGSRYFVFVYSQNGNHVYIARMSNPWTLSTTPVEIIRPTQAWEGQWTTEGPAVLVRNGRVFISYSANDCGSDDYSMGLVSADQGGDLLNPAAWTKANGPVMSTNATAGVFAPGHNSFTTSPDGSEDYVVYHANSAAGQGCGNHRTARVQRLTWGTDGAPVFPTPASTGLQTPAWDVGADALVRNAGFERDRGARSLPSGWTTTDRDQSAFYTEPGGHTGAFQGTQWAARPYRVYTYQTIPDLPAGNYTLTAWVKSSGGQAEAGVEVKDYAGNGSKNYLPIGPAGKWTQVTIPGVSVTAGQATVGFWSNASAGQWLNFDDVELTPSS
ncbi:glycoside hydrolase family 43 protein [Kineococcus sp. NBC_00420]|uniref:glycoside hydrolase family 43 protein n=1 Tax=Kineococcus sp. NBC_00420 TaxID=2903564 RepID=UPI002E216263